MKSRTTCTDPEAGGLLAAYDAGVLEAHERAGFERHVELCEACREELFELAPQMTRLRQDPGKAAAHLAGMEPGTEAIRG